MPASSVAEHMRAARSVRRRTIGLRGPLEGPLVGALREATLSAVAPDMDLIVDLSEVTAIAAEGLAVLDDVAVAARADGKSFRVRLPASDKALSDAVAAVARRDHPAGRGR